MQFDAALAAQETFRRAESELGSDWDTAVNSKTRFPPMPDRRRGRPMRACSLSPSATPRPIPFKPSVSYITWQQVTEETIAHHFQTGLRLCETFLASPDGKHQADVEQITELYGSFRDGLGLDEEDEIQVEFRRDTPKGGD